MSTEANSTAITEVRPYSNFSAFRSSAGQLPPASTEDSTVEVFEGAELSRNWRALSSKAAGLVLQSVLMNEATKSFTNTCISGFDAPQGAAATRAPADEVRAITRQMFKSLSGLHDADLDYGNRFNALSEAFGSLPSERPAEYCEALSRLLHVDSRFVTDEAKAAVIRYCAFFGEDIPLSEITRVLISALDSNSTEQIVAAAKTLREIADPGSVPAIKVRLRRDISCRARQAIEAAIDEIGTPSGSASSSR